MRSIQVAFFGLFTVFVSLFGFFNASNLSSLVLSGSLLGTFYSPVLDLIHNVWILLSAVAVVFGVMLIVAGIFGVFRSVVVWLLGLGLSATLVGLSIAQIMNYFEGGGFAGEGEYGVVGTFIWVSCLVYLITPHIRAYLVSVKQAATIRADEPGQVPSLFGRYLD